MCEHWIAWTVVIILAPIGLGCLGWFAWYVSGRSDYTGS